MNNSKKNPLSIFAYRGANITFRTDAGHVMVNATEMAKKFNKKPDNFLRTQQTQKYIEVLGQFSNMRTEKLVSVKNGGTDNGTWIHELIAMRFAQWLSPHFSIWVDKHIKELLTKGTTQVSKPKKVRQIRKKLPVYVETFDKMYSCFRVYCTRYPTRKEYQVYYDQGDTTLQDLLTSKQVLENLIRNY